MTQSMSIQSETLFELLGIVIAHSKINTGTYAWILLNTS